MDKSEKVFLGLALLVLVAIVLWRINPTAETPSNAGSSDDSIPVTDLVGVSQTPENSDFETGQARYISNRRPFFLPPLDNFLPTITSGQAGQSSDNPASFVRRIVGTIRG